MDLAKLDLGISVLDPSLDKFFDTSSLANDLQSDELLYTLVSLPSDLFGFYTQFAIGVSSRNRSMKSRGRNRSRNKRRS